MQGARTRIGPGVAGRGASAARRDRCAERGLTLIELSIAIAIAAILFSAVVSGVGAMTGAKAKQATGELAGTIRAIYDEAALSGRTCRIVFELPAENDEDGSVHYQSQCAEGAVATLGDRDEELRAEAESARAVRRDGRREEPRRNELSMADDPTLADILASEQARVEHATRFQEFEPMDVGRSEIPPAVRMSVWVRGQREPVRSGTAYLYFHPQGYTDRAMVFVEQGDNAWTISVSPLTGKAEVIPGLERIPDR